MGRAGSTGRGRFDRALIAVEALAGAGVVALVVGRDYGGASTVAFVAAAIAVAATAYFMFRMAAALGDDTLDVLGRTVDEERERLEREKALLLAGLKEFEGDAAIGKVSAEDYQALKRTAEARAVRIIKAIKDTDAHYLERAERLVRERLGASAPPKPASPPTTPVAETRTAPAAPPPAAPVAAAAVTEPSASRAAEAPAPRPGATLADPLLFDDRPIAFADGEAGLVCGHCDTANDADARYCIGCGRPREDAA
jgi:hypothetical protein